jgi:hypothetical protein
MRNNPLLLAAAMLVAMVVMAKLIGSDQPQGPQPRTYEHPNYAQNKQGGPTNPAPSYLQQYADYCNNAAEKDKNRWQQHMACEKSTDIVIAIFTIMLTLATIVSGAIGAGQVWLTRRQFVTGNPPVMGVRGFRLEMPVNGKLPSVTFMVSNDGKSDALIEQDNFTALVLTHTDLQEMERQPFPAYANSRRLLRDNYIPKKRLAHTLRLTGFQDEMAAFHAVGAGTATLVCFGFIRYRDSVGGRYETHFYRTYIPGEDRFERHSNPDYDNGGEAT